MSDTHDPTQTVIERIKASETASFYARMMTTPHLDNDALNDVYRKFILHYPETEPVRMAIRNLDIRDVNWAKVARAVY